MSSRIYFVLHLHPSDRWPGQLDGQQYQIQVVNEVGQGVAWGFVGDSDERLRIDNIEIPLAVINAARRQMIGQGDYVDEYGNRTFPQGC